MTLKSIIEDLKAIADGMSPDDGPLDLEADAWRLDWLIGKLLEKVNEEE